MILTRLKEFWDREGGGVPRGYQPAFLTKRIVLDQGGNLVNVESLSGETRGKRNGKTFAVPREQPRRAGDKIKARLVHDNPNYALGMAGAEDSQEKVDKRHDAYLLLLKKCFDQTQEPSLGAILKWIERGGPQDPGIRKQIDPDLEELLFEVEGANPTDLPSVQEFWSKKEDSTVGTCLVTGLRSPIAHRMPYPIKGVPGGQSSGTMLVSVNNPSGQSYGLDAAFNSPIGETAAESVCNALNKLLRDAKHSFRIADSVYLYWSRNASGFDLGSYVEKPTEADVSALLRTATKGGPALAVNEPDFFVLSLTAYKSRIVVRDYQETTLPTVQAHLSRWLQRLRLRGLDRGFTGPFGVFRLAASLYRDPKEIPKRVPVELVRCALGGGPLPKDILMLAVRRNVAMQGPFEEFNRKKQLSLGRLTLIKACLCDIAMEEDNMISLNTEHENPAYHCGRLLAVLESIQRVAIPNLNATLVDRHYGSACASPGVSFGGLLKDATSAHLPKLRKDSPGAFRALDARLIDVVGHIGDEFPKTLDYTGQGLFALGYYHQRASDIAAARANKELKALADATGDSKENPE